MKTIIQTQAFWLVVLTQLIYCGLLNAQSWNQNGNDIDGESSGDRSGISTSINSDGSIVAIGAYWNDGNGNKSGHVRIFEYNLGSWNQLGNDLNGESSGDESGYSLSISSDGTIVAVGAAQNDGNGNKSGHVRVFRYDLGSWTQIGNDIDGESSGDQSGCSVSLSADGSIVAIGARLNDGNGNKSGHVRIYENTSDVWVQLGNDINGESSGNEMGYSVSLSSDGLRVATGTRYHDDDKGKGSNQARVFEFQSGSWVQLGNDIPMPSSEDAPGISVSLNAPGTILALGANTDDKKDDDACVVKVYELQMNSWTQLGNPLNMDPSEEESKCAVSLNSSGYTLAIGINKIDDDKSSNAGYVRIFDYISGSWTKRGFDINGEDNNDHFGYSLSLNADGSTIAIGGPRNDGNGSKSGHTRVYEFIYSSDTWTGQLSSAWNTSGNWLSGEIPSASTNVIIPSTPANQPQIVGEADCMDIFIESNASLTIISDASGTGTFIPNGSVVNNGTVNVERYFTGNDIDWHLVSSPVSNALAGVFLELYLQNYDEQTGLYTEIIDETTPLNAMEGYGLYSNLAATNTVTFSGNINYGVLSRNFTADNDGWNLMGNPYTSSIDWERISIPVEMSNEVHYIRASDGNNLSYVKGIGGTGSQYIPPMQGFFIQANSAGSFALDNTVRTHSGSGNYYKDDIDPFVLTVTNDIYSDDTWIHFNENAGEEHDGIFDAYKRVSSSNPDLPQIFSITSYDEYLSINGMPQTESVKIGFTAVNSGIYTIKANETMEGTGIQLEDLNTGTQSDLLSDDYTFSYTSGDDPARFVLHFAPLATHNYEDPEIKVYSYGRYAYIVVPEIKQGKIFVFNGLGQQVAFSKINNTLNKIELEANNWYIIKVQFDNKIITKKVLVR